MLEKIHRKSLFLVLGIVISLMFPLPVFAQSSSEVVPTSAAEAYALEQIRAGKIANLAARFREEERILSDTFLENLLQNPPPETTRYGIRIENATFPADVDFQSMDINYELALQDCIFEGHVDLSMSHFTHNVSFARSTFQFMADFYGAQFDRWLYLDEAVFKNQLDMTFVNIGGGLNARGTQFAGAEGAIFNTMDVKQGLFLPAAVFAGPVDFGYVHTAGAFDAQYARFSDPEQRVNFNSLRIEKSLFLQNAVFAGSADFGHSQIGITFEADGADFTNENKTVEFSSMRVGSGIYLRNAVFAGPVDFTYVQAGDFFNAVDARFNNREYAADFYSMRVEKKMDLEKTIFEGPVDFGRAQVGSVLDASDARFNNPEKEVSFNSLKTDGDIFLLRTVFAGPVDFSFSEIEYFKASEAEFQNRNSGPEFHNMVVKNLAWFDRTVIKGDLDLSDSTFLDLSIYGAEDDSTFTRINLTRTTINRELTLWSLQIQDLSAGLLAVQGPTFITNTKIVGSANFENSKFSELTIENVNWPEDSAQTNLGGMQYRQFKITKEGDEDAWNDIIHLLDHSKYNAQAYKVLENHFAEQGYPERADEVYVAYKRRERAEALNSISVDWWWNLFLDRFVLYGRSPGRALIWGGALILIGCFIFRKAENMVSLSRREGIPSNTGYRGIRSRKMPVSFKRAESDAPYSAFWYSLDLFIPFVDLGFDDKWCPKPSCGWRVVYSKIHMLAGWVLIPIGLLTITGVIK